MVIKYVETNYGIDNEEFIELVYKHFQYLEDLPKLSHSKKEIKNILNGTNQYNIFVYHDKNLIGYLLGDFRIIDSDKRYVFYISYMYITSAYRNKGIGRKIMQGVIKNTKKYNCNYIMLTCDVTKNLDSYYKKYGFVEDKFVPKTYPEHIVMTYFIN